MDIVARLREEGKQTLSKTCLEAADEIERLRLEVKEANARAYVMAKEVGLWQSRVTLEGGGGD